MQPLLKYWGRILLQKFNMKSICIFCGSNYGIRPEYEHAAVAMGQLLAQSGIRLIYGGGKVGLMGAVANAALAAGGQVVGIIPQFLQDKELAHLGLTELHVVDSMHSRKAMMNQMSDGFVSMPGGFGTFEELFEVVSWAQLGMHQKPIGLLDIADFYQPLLHMVHHASAQGFARAENCGIFLSAAEPQDLLNKMRDYQPRSVTKWLEQKAI